MPGVSRVYTYRFKPPGDALTLATAITAAAERLMRFNKHVLKVDTVNDADDMLMRVTVHGHDQWWIKKNIVYPVAHILTKAGVKVSDVKLEDVAQGPRDYTSWRQDPDRMPHHDEAVLFRKRPDAPWYRKHEDARYLRVRADGTPEQV